MLPSRAWIFAFALASVACSQALGLDDDFRLTSGGAGGSPSGAGGETGPGAGGTGAQGGTTTTVGGQGGVGPGSGGGGASPTTGCSDGTREAYTDVDAEPDIAGCSGGWDVAGVATAPSMQPACARVSGNDSQNPNGTGCSVADLCSVGWHVCDSSADVQSSAASGQCPSAPASPAMFATRQAGPTGSALDCDASGVDGVMGCGASLGAGVEPSCSPLNHGFRVGHCNSSTFWFCGISSPVNDEADIVTKSGPGEGGVLCCRD